MADPASEEEQRKAESELDAALIAFEIGLLAIIAERLGSIEGLSFSEIYALIPEDIAKIRKAINKGVKNLQSVSSRILNRMALANDQWAAQYYAVKSIKSESTYTNTSLNNLLTRKIKAADEYISTACRSSVVKIAKETADPITGKIKVLQYKPIEQAYQAIVTNTSTHMAAGNITGQQAVEKAVSSLAESGLRVQYQSGVTRNLHTAVKTNIMDAYRSTMSEMREAHGALFGADGVEVSAHALCAPDHQPYQGMQYSYERKRGYDLWDDIQNEPARPLVTGANCGHFIFPVILGISSGAYSKKELEELKRLSNEKVTFKGLSGEELTMSRYDASQYQRKLESNIREKKKLAFLQESSNVDSSAANKAVKYYQSEYKRISEKVGLTRRMENTRIYIPK